MTGSLGPRVTMWELLLVRTHLEVIAILVLLPRAIVTVGAHIQLSRPWRPLWRTTIYDLFALVGPLQLPGIQGHSKGSYAAQAVRQHGS